MAGGGYPSPYFFYPCIRIRARANNTLACWISLFLVNPNFKSSFAVIFGVDFYTINGHTCPKNEHNNSSFRKKNLAK